ncbi:MAG: hypothetical protein KAV87_51860 [Desulfobacteraceae bacterium]|nr:hypothetical protein [Desulfobacteraceae bacterium]
MNMTDVVGIGALNEDYHLKDRSTIRDLINRLSLPIENRREAFVSDGKVEEILKDQGQSAFDVIPGGSALNTIRTIKSLDLGLSTGFVGVLGKKDCRLDIRESLSGIDDSLIKDVPNRVPSRCVVLGTGNDTKLLTAPGATNEFRAVIKEQDLVDYLSKCRWVHISSFENVAILRFVVSAIKKAKRINNCLKTSFDPGHDYTEQLYPEVMEALEICDLLFLNFREFCQLAQRDSAKPKTREIIRSAKALFENTPFAGQAIVLKSAASSFWLQTTDSSVRLRRYWHKWFPSFIIRDDVGAGDVFSAGVIAGMLSPRFSEFGKGPTRLATALVRRKLRVRFDIPLSDFASITATESSSARNAELFNFRDFIAVYVPPVVRYLLAILAGGIATLIATK